MRHQEVKSEMPVNEKVFAPKKIIEEKVRKLPFFSLFLSLNNVV